jgi:hypothetical protein
MGFFNGEQLAIAAYFSKMLLSLFQKSSDKFPRGIVNLMRKSLFAKVLSLAFVLLLTGVGASAQFKSIEVSDEEGIPVLIKNLPDWENARKRATHTNNVNDLRAALGARPVFDLIDFTGGTEAVAAPYDAGKLLIIEFTNPQSSIEADNLFKQRLAELPPSTPTLYRRIGNYNAFVFDVTDDVKANALLDEVKYDKTVQWLGEDPFYEKKAERFFAIRAADIFLSTALLIVGGIVLAIITGIGIGLVYFRVREQERAMRNAFSDAGGITRLNLDGLSDDTPSKGLLTD